MNRPLAIERAARGELTVVDSGYFRLIELPQESRSSAVCIILRSIQVGSNALCPDPHLVCQLVCQLGVRSAPVRGCRASGLHPSPSETVQGAHPAAVTLSSAAHAIVPVGQPPDRIDALHRRGRSGLAGLHRGGPSRPTTATQGRTTLPGRRLRFDSATESRMTTQVPGGRSSVVSSSRETQICCLHAAVEGKPIAFDADKAECSTASPFIS